MFKTKANSSQYAHYALELLERNYIFNLLEDIVAIRKELKDIASTSNPSNLHEIQQEIHNLASSQQSLLHCPTVDEHTLLLACLKKIDELSGSNLYRTVLRDMLKKQLHKIENCGHHMHFVGREKEIEDIKRILQRSARNNVIIIGPTGVGKTTLASSLGTYLSKTHLFQLFPENEHFIDHVIHIVSSTTPSKSLFFLDELVTFQPNHIKYIVENCQLIATANESSFKKFSAEHPHIVSKCEVIILEEPPEKDLKDILTYEQDHIKQHRTITFSAEVVPELIHLGKQYLPDISFPAKGLSLLEEAVMASSTKGENTVTADTLKHIIAQKTNIPLASLTDLDKKDLSQLPDKLKAMVKGQEEAIEKVAKVIQRSRLGFGKKNRPIGSFLFVGPSGVGKTELSKAIAQELFGDPEMMVRLDMSEFSEAHMVQRMIGSPPGYVGYEEGGQLTNPVKNKPYTLVLLDEIEKAHPRVFDIFLQVLDDGRLTDGQGKKIDFRNTVIIATSNAGIEEILDMVAEGATQAQINKEIKEILQDYFRIEFINRFDEITIFNALKPAALKEIAKLHIEKLKKELAKRTIGLSISEEALEALAKEGYDPRYGARGLLRVVQEKIENKLAEMIISGELKEGQRIEF